MKSLHSPLRDIVIVHVLNILYRHSIKKTDCHSKSINSSTNKNIDTIYIYSQYINKYSYIGAKNNKSYYFLEKVKEI